MVRLTLVWKCPDAILEECPGLDAVMESYTTLVIEMLKSSSEVFVKCDQSWTLQQN